MIIQGVNITGGIRLDPPPPPPPSALFIASAPFNDADYNNGGRAYILGGDSQIVLSDPNGASGGQFGYSGGAINADANLIVIGNQNQQIAGFDLDGNLLFTQSSSSTGTTNESWGQFCAIGTKLVTSDYNYSDGASGFPGFRRGKIYVYDLDGTNRQDISSPAPTQPNEWFGNTLAVTDTKIACGATNMDNGRGALFIMNYDGTSMVKIVPAVRDVDDFLSEVSINSTKIAGGARGVGNDNQGAAYVFNHDGTGEVKIVPSDSQGGMYFGISTAMTQTKLIVGSPDFGNGGTGAVYVYNLDGTGEQKITTAVAGVANYGFTVAISDTQIAVGSGGSTGSNVGSGSTFVYDIDGTNEMQITAIPGYQSDNFGGGVSITANKILIGADGDTAQGANVGSVYLFDTDGTNQIQVTASDGTANSRFGSAVSF